MDHTVHGYLVSRTTEELEMILAYYLREDAYVGNEYIILDILQILEDRYIPEEIPAHVCEKCKELCPKAPNRNETVC